MIAEAERRAPGKPIVCASGHQPLRPDPPGQPARGHDPAPRRRRDRRRGIECDHLISWDDYDRFRKVPAGGVDPSWAEHIGKPLTAVPAPPGSPHANWAEHFKAPLLEALAELGVEFRRISQTEQYTSGAYREQILLAMRERGAHRRGPGPLPHPRPPRPHAEAGRGKGRSAKAAEAGRAGGRRRRRRPPRAPARRARTTVGAAAGYYPYKPYCTVCGTDFTTVTAYDDDTTAAHLRVPRAGTPRRSLSTSSTAASWSGRSTGRCAGPTRACIFEPSGVDHRRPARRGSSAASWSRGLRRRAADRPDVRLRRHQRHGEDEQLGRAACRPRPTRWRSWSRAAAALAVRPPPAQPVLQRRLRPGGPAAVRRVGLALRRKVADGTAQPADLAAAHPAPRARRPATCPTTPRPLPYRTLASVVDITTGDEEQTLRILRDLDPSSPVGSLDELRPRLDCAQHWVNADAGRGAHPRAHRAGRASCSPRSTSRQRESLRLLVDGLDEHWSLDGLTSLVYGVPKVQAGLPPDAKADAGAEGGPAAVLRAALPAAGRPGHRPAAAHAAAGRRRGPGPRTSSRR